jgi:CelD/BcsL family acetyltransferase involved in cellulose biosynthesis
MGGAVRVECFQKPESVPRFMADASAISRRTYQWNLLDLGFRDTDAMRTRLRWVAERGWLRSYVMYCRDVPVAFMWGHQFGDGYYIDDGGYDPDYAKLSVGSVLQLKLIEHLFAGVNRPQFLDFSTGFGTHKGRFGNFSRRELNVLILPATPRNRLLRSSYLATDRLSKGTVLLLDRFGLKARIKRLIRRSSSQQAE